MPTWQLQHEWTSFYSTFKMSVCSALKKSSLRFHYLNECTILWSLLLTIAQEADHGHPLVIALIFLLQTNCTLILSQSRIQTNHFTDGLLKDVSVFFFISSCQMGTVELGKFVWANFLKSFYWFELKMFLLMKFHCYAQSLMNKDHVL